MAFILHAVGDRAVRFLDVGNLGDGASPNLLIKSEVERRGGEYVGLDSNEELTRALGLPNQVVGDLHRSPFPSGSFDVVYAGEVLEHTWTPSTMIRECWRILRPGGHLLLDTPNLYCVWNVLRYFLFRIDTLGDVRRLTYEEAKDSFRDRRERGEALHQPQHKILYTPAMLTQLLETHSFRPLSIGFTRKPVGFAQRILLSLFPHGGNHLCAIAEKTTLDRAFADVTDVT